jgi:predicted enzyme related to lactoylglutathione lyase
MKRISEVALFTADVAALAGFYSRLLDTAPLYQGEDIAIFDLGGVQLLIHFRYPDQPGGPANEDHFAFRVDDVDTAGRKLEEHGLALEVKPKDFDWGRSTYLRDPDGRFIELTQSK